MYNAAYATCKVPAWEGGGTRLVAELSRKEGKKETGNRKQETGTGTRLYVCMCIYWSIDRAGSGVEWSGVEWSGAERSGAELDITKKATG